MATEAHCRNGPIPALGGALLAARAERVNAIAARIARMAAIGLIVATPVSAQQRADTTQIRAVAVAFSLPETVRSVGRVRFVADTAWVFVHNPHSMRAVQSTTGRTPRDRGRHKATHDPRRASCE
jgi:hypothetical protein